MRRLLLVAACFLAGAGGAHAAPPKPDATAWLVENPATGEILTAHDIDTRVPIASITKLMTVLVVLDHKRLTDVVDVDPRVETTGEESVSLRGGEQLTVLELIKAALIQSANDAADALALSVSPDYGAFAKLLNAKARELGLTHSSFVRPDGLDAPGEYSTARDVTRLALAAMRVPVVRETVAESDDTIPGHTLHTWNDLLGVVPGVFGVKTGHTNLAGWSQVAAVHGRSLTIYVTILGSPTREQRNDDLSRLLAWGLGQYRVVTAIGTDREYARVRLPYGKAPVPLVAAKPQLDVVRLGRPLTERVTAPLVASLPVRKGQPLGRVEVWDGKRLLGSRPLVASRAVARPGVPGRIGWYATRTAHHVLGFFT